MSFIHGFTLLLIFQLIGEVIVRALGLSIPGPVLGMLLLFFGLLMVKVLPQSLSMASNSLLSHLSLLFIPAGVGLVVYLKALGDIWLPVATAVVTGLVVTMVVTAALMLVVQRMLSKGKADERYAFL